RAFVCQRPGQACSNQDAAAGSVGVGGCGQHLRGRSAVLGLDSPDTRSASRESRGVSEVVERAQARAAPFDRDRGQQHQRFRGARWAGWSLPGRTLGVRSSHPGLQALQDPDRAHRARSAFGSLLPHLSEVKSYCALMSPEDAKRAAARAALEYLPESGVIGLGSGSTASFFIQEVAALVKQGRQLVGVATSEQSRALAERLGIELLGDAGPWPLS